MVVGAGLAGLAAAWTASADGHDVTVLEARDRVGGRTWSHEIAPGVVVERGGEWIDADQHTIRRFCADLGLPIAPHGVSFHRRMVRGRLPGLDELESTLEAVSKEIPPEDCSVSEAFEAALGERYAEDPAYLRIVTSTAGDPARASARFHVARAEAAGIDGAGRVVGGNQQISQELAHRLGSVRLGAAVTTIGGDGVGLADGSTVPADRVVVAVPLALLDTLAWTDGFPDRWREGLAHVATGTAAKLSLPATRNRARGVQHPQHAWWAWNSLDYSGRAGLAAVSAFAGGDAARTALGVEHGPERWTEEVRTLRHDLRLRPEHALLTDWASEPWTAGGYSHVLVGHTETANALLTEPVGTVVLAGEYTDPEDSGTMNGALASGVRAARSLGSSG
ncbi:FAD-dependent oxidoreductase [Nocardioides ultimimeridianus]